MLLTKEKRKSVFLILVLIIPVSVSGFKTVGKKLLEPKGEDDLEESRNEDFESYEIGFQCLACHWGAKILVNYANTENTVDEFLKFAALICRTLGIESKLVCDGIVKNVGEQLFYILKESHGKVSAKDICGMVLEGPCSEYSERMNSWTLDIPDLDQPSPIPVPSYPPTGNDSPRQKILHLSDLHLQHDYTVGSRTDCGDPICCFPHNGLATQKSNSAGFYGDYHCDLPPWTMEAAIKMISEVHKDIDYVILTGDFPAHDIWKQNRESNLKSANSVAQVMKKYFSDVPVYVAIGNHESYPVNMFPIDSETGKYNPEWLYGNFAKFYEHWLPDQEQQMTLKKGGFYTILLRPGLRLISVNTNVCNDLNWFLLLNFDDPGHVLHWLYKLLHEAELKNETIYIIGHIPPGKNCFTKWSHEYNRLIQRFNNTVLGQFYGHTHLDEFELFYSLNETIATKLVDPVSVAYLAPSMTPLKGLNPAYRIYEIDGSHEATTNLILDHSTYYFDLTRSNVKGQLVLKKEYSAKKFLNLPDLSASSWNNYVRQLATDTKAFQTFRGIRARQGPEKEEACGKKCRKKLLCFLVRSITANDGHCAEIEKLVHQTSNDLSFWEIFWNL